MKVFLVEDAPLLRTRLAALIQSIPGAEQVGGASGADEALAGILRTHPDAVVLDLHLSQGHGLYVLKALHKAAPHIPVYVITNFPSETYRAATARYGARGFFDKTTEFDKLRDALAAGAAG